MLSSVISSLAYRLIASCQTPAGHPLRDSFSIAKLARSCVLGGAAGIRANGPADVQAIRASISLPIIGIEKRMQEDGKVLITPSFEDARELVRAGADIIALDCTARGQNAGALARIREIQHRLGVPVMADIATLEEATAAEKAGADLVASTMRGYTAETHSVQAFEPQFIAALSQRLNVPVIAEGRIATPSQAAAAIRAGAYAVIAGTAITRPDVITTTFLRAMEAERAQFSDARHVIGIDLGATNTKAAIVSGQGTLQFEFALPTPAAAGRDALLSHLKDVALGLITTARAHGLSPEAVGIASAGWIDPKAGSVVYATGNLPGWTGTRIADEMERHLSVPIRVENDANALAVAERHFGAGKSIDDFVCLTLGTGVGGGVFTGGRLLRGAHSLAGALGHITVQCDGPFCTCGRRGCLEVYANAAALLRYAGSRFQTVQQLVEAAQTGTSEAVQAVRIYAGHLSMGLASIARILDPELVILAGGIAQRGELLCSVLEEALSQVMADSHGRPRVRLSPLGYYGGVLGAAALIFENVCS